MQMKKLLFSLLSCLILQFTFAQTGNIYQDTTLSATGKQVFTQRLATNAPQDPSTVPPPTTIPPVYDCTPVSSIDGNLILNPGMLTNAAYPGTPAADANPFGLRYIDNWINTHGTPTVYSNFAGHNNILLEANLTWGEGIAGKIQQLIPGHNYWLKFDWATYFGTSDPAYIDRDYNIYLIHCTDAPLYFTDPSTSAYPQIPPGSQRIYCEHDFYAASNFKPSVCFNANSNYDMIWIFPKKGTTASSTPIEVGFSNPYLIDKSSLEIVVQSSPINPCIKTLFLNIAIPDAMYEWYINGAIFSTLQNPQIDASTQNGTITLNITPNNIPSNNACSINGCVLSANVFINGNCIPPVQNDEIWTWMSGNNTPNQLGDYGILAMESSTNKPGARTATMSWTDQAGNLWLFGGGGFSNTVTIAGNLNDLWRFNISTNKWAWINGSYNLNELGTYGTIGVPNNTNRPGGRNSGQTWIDQSGNLWLFGGWGKNINVSSDAALDDMWKYNVSTNQWTWVNGSTSPVVNPVYGTQGVASQFNDPGGRGNAVTWVDVSGNFWMYGGLNDQGILDDLWKYNVSTNQWTWMKGDNTGSPVYGTKGIGAVANKPGRKNNAVGWADNSGNLWMFGGEDQYSTSYQYYNDLWKYNIASNTWTWISGDNIVNQIGSYGTKGIASASNKPGARRMSIGWIDVPKGNLWLFGGQGVKEETTGSFNDLWKYNIATDKWTWISGENAFNVAPVYGTLGIGTKRTNPGARSYLVSWREPSNGTLWLFGGTLIKGRGNDLWKYNVPSTGQCCQARTAADFQNEISNYSKQNNLLNVSDEIDLQRKQASGIGIKSIELYTSNGQLIKQLTNTDKSVLLLNNIKPSGINSGLYFLRITFKDDTVKTIKRFF
jgi:hypothetical protein